MTMENSGHEGPSPQAGDKLPVTHAQVPNPSRRRFNRAGVGASAVVLTLASRSVLANVACTTASGFTSLNQSSRGEAAPVCTGATPEIWMTRSPWPVAMTTQFSLIFGSASPSLKVGAPITVAGVSDTGGGKSGLKLNDATLQQAMFGSDTNAVVKYLIAALLNARGNYNAYPTEVSVIKIFQEWQSKNYYEVSAGIRWNDADIIKYLLATQTPGTAANKL